MICILTVVVRNHDIICWLFVFQILRWRHTKKGEKARKPWHHPSQLSYRRFLNQQQNSFCQKYLPLISLPSVMDTPLIIELRELTQPQQVMTEKSFIWRKPADRYQSITCSKANLTTQDNDFGFTFSSSELDELTSLIGSMAILSCC